MRVNGGLTVIDVEVFNPANSFSHLLTKLLHARIYNGIERRDGWGNLGFLEIDTRGMVFVAHFLFYALRVNVKIELTKI